MKKIVLLFEVFHLLEALWRSYRSMTTGISSVKLRSRLYQVAAIAYGIFDLPLSVSLRAHYRFGPLSLFNELFSPSIEEVQG
jgi:hypothetical protein